METAIVILSVALWLTLLGLIKLWFELNTIKNKHRETEQETEQEIHELNAALIKKIDFNQYLRGELDQMQRIALSLAGEKFGKDFSKATKILIIEGEEQIQTEIKLNGQ